jgi:hypothetical protein
MYHGDMNRYLSVFRAFVSNRQGAVVITQWPNLPLWLVIIISGLRMVMPGGQYLIFDVAAIGLLSYWGWSELKDGSSPFRQLLGLGGLMLAAHDLLNLGR